MRDSAMTRKENGEEVARLSAASEVEERLSGTPPRLLPVHDYFVLPALSLLTVVAMFGAAEIGARLAWPAVDQGYCMYFDPIEGPHAKPNCTTVLKIPEGERVTLTFNNCGYRSKTPCGPKAPDTIRVAMLGSSVAEGYAIAYEKTMATQMAEALKASCARKIDVQNLAVEGCPPIYSYRHVDEALKLKPDAIVMPLNPWDIEQDVDARLLNMRVGRQPINRMPEPAIKLNATQLVQKWLQGSRTALVAQHYMLKNRDAFLKLYVFAGGDHTAFVRCPFTPAWEKRFEMTDLLLGEMAAKIHAAGVPFLVVGVPERAQVLMLDDHDLPKGADAYAFTRRLARIAAKHGILYLDALRSFSETRDREDLFYVVNGHPTARAQRIMGQATARELIAAKLPGFSSCQRQ